MAAVLCGNFYEFRRLIRSATFDRANKFHLIVLKHVLKRFIGDVSKSSRSKYKKTVYLPETAFPLWLNPRNRPQHDRDVLQKCKFASLYQWQRSALQSGREFVLHDGPPYANGTLHAGHVVNKVLKDIILRHELLNGSLIHFVPGWDCHGLPIELKAVSSTSNEEISPSEIRAKARSFAEKAIEIQRATFQSWGILGDWNKTCYFTFENGYVQKQLHSFYTMFEKGLIYRDLKPIYWSPSTRTALAEAELTYNEHHISKSAIVRFQLLTPPFNVKTEKPLYALVWTTTPWTLPANAAILYRSNIEYSAIEIENDDGCYIVAHKLVPNLAKNLRKEIKVLNTFLGKSLKRVTYAHPFHKEEAHKFFEADHVTDAKGTGLVHCAPGHGREDYVVGVKYNLPVVSVADLEGNYSEIVGPALAGKDLLGNGTEAVLELLQSDIIHTEELKHSYPYDWRTKKPVIVLASRQWFFDCSSVKDSAVNEIMNVKFVPERNYQKHLMQLVKNRPFWCISRQRVWGVPVPVLFKRDCSRPIISRSLIEHYCKLIDKHGTDFWWTLSIDELCPPDLASELNIDLNDIERCADILDIWYDSGLSWMAALDGRTADLCLEGVDQFTGWFQSSLLTSVALTGKSPYKTVFTHGFVVDEDGHKMSKSVGNVIDPQDITVGGKNPEKQPAYGVDTLRWWVASHSMQHSNIPISINLIKASSEIIQKLRGTIKYLLGALSDFPSSCSDSNISEDQLFFIDRYMLHSLHEVQKSIDVMYREHSYNLICRTINEFIVNDVSALYITITKDRLYCDKRDSVSRRSCQFVMSQILGFLMRSIAPIVPLMVEESYLYHPCKTDKLTYFQHQSLNPFGVQDKWHCPSVEDTIRAALEIKKVVNKDFKSGQSWESDVIIHVPVSLFLILKPLVENQTPTHSQLAEILQVGSVILEPPQNQGSSLDQASSVTVEATHSESALCHRCRRYRCQGDSDLCARCDRLLHSASNVPESAAQ